MRIAMVGRDLPRASVSGGVSGQMHLLAGALARSGHDITVYALNPPEQEVGYSYRPIAASGKILKHRRTALYMVPWWASRIALDDFDVVHAHGEDQFIRTRRPVVRTFHGAEWAEARYSTNLRQRLYHLSMVPLEWISEQRATVVVTVSQNTQRYLGRGALVIPNGYDPAVFYPAGPKSLQPSILFVGDLRSRKRAELLLHVFASVVAPAVPQAELWMVTTASVRAAGVRSFGRVRAEDLANLYRQAWVYCMPSSYEGFGVPYLEAMASGTAVVATRNGGAEEVLDDGRAGCLSSDQDLGQDLVSLLRDTPGREALAAKGLARAQGYRIGSIAAKYEELYQSISSNWPRATSSQQ